MHGLPTGSGGPDWSKLKDYTQPISKEQEGAQKKFEKKSSNADVKGFRPQQPKVPEVNPPPRPAQALPPQPAAYPKSPPKQSVAQQGAAQRPRSPAGAAVPQNLQPRVAPPASQPQPIQQPVKQTTPQAAVPQNQQAAKPLAQPRVAPPASQPQAQPPIAPPASQPQAIPQPVKKTTPQEMQIKYQETASMLKEPIERFKSRVDDINISSSTKPKSKSDQISDKVIANLKAIPTTENENKLQNLTNETIKLLIDYSKENPDEINNMLKKGHQVLRGLDISKFSSPEELMKLDPKQRVILLVSIIQNVVLKAEAGKEQQPIQSTAAKPSPPPEFNVREINLGKVQNPILASAHQASPANTEVVSPHIAARGLCKHEGNSCFINTTLQMIAHYKKYQVLFDKPPVRRLGELEQTYNNRCEVYNKGKLLLDQVRQGSNQNFAGVAEFFRAISVFIEFPLTDVNKVVWNTANDLFDKNTGKLNYPGDIQNALGWITAILGDGDKAPTDIPTVPKRIMDQITAARLNPPPPGSSPQEIGLHKQAKMRDAKQISLGKEPVLRVEVDKKLYENSPNRLLARKEAYPEEFEMPPGSGNKYQLEMVIMGGGGHTYPYIRQGDKFVRYDDMNQPPSDPISLDEAFKDTTQPLHSCYYVKVKSQG